MNTGALEVLVLLTWTSKIVQHPLYVERQPKVWNGKQKSMETVGLKHMWTSAWLPSMSEAHWDLGSSSLVHT